MVLCMFFVRKLTYIQSTISIHWRLDFQNLELLHAYLVYIFLQQLYIYMIMVCLIFNNHTQSKSINKVNFSKASKQLILKTCIVFFNTIICSFNLARISSQVMHRFSWTSSLKFCTLWDAADLTNTRVWLFLNCSYHLYTFCYDKQLFFIMCTYSTVGFTWFDSFWQLKKRHFIVQLYCNLTEFGILKTKCQWTSASFIWK